ncbi:hypothetical protein GF402_03650 [Candidatus Fermentibacteria bacterium]|nr:hypothetical protein [Candidatus Fermentibacteria bacterium]
MLEERPEAKRLFRYVRKEDALRSTPLPLSLLLFLILLSTLAYSEPRDRINDLLDLEIVVPLEIQWWYNQSHDDSAHPTNSWALANVYATPTEDSEPIGEFTVETVWAENNILKFVLGYRPAGRDSVIVWRDRLGDWGYGIHQFVLQKRDDWVLLPPGPYGEEAWIRVQDNAEGEGLYGRVVCLEGRLIEIDSMSVLSVGTGDSAKIDRQIYLVTSVDSQMVEFRPELPSDMPSGASDDLSEHPADSLPIYRVWLRRMLTVEGEPRFEIAYPRGC